MNDTWDLAVSPLTPGICMLEQRPSTGQIHTVNSWGHENIRGNYSLVVGEHFHSGETEVKDWDYSKVGGTKISLCQGFVTLLLSRYCKKLSLTQWGFVPLKKSFLSAW